MAEEPSSPLQPNPSIINPTQNTIDAHSHSHSHEGMIPEYTNNTQLQELGQNTDTHITNHQINENKNMGFVGNCNIDNTQITNFTDFPKSDPLYGQEAQKNDTQMTNFADLAKSDPLYGEKVEINDTQMTDFTDLPKSDSLNGQKREENEGLVGNVKKEKRVRKRGKGAKKDVVCDFERVTVCDCDKRGDRARVVYLKEQIEALRYVSVEEQKRKWSEVYCGLGDVVAKEYDCLVGFKDDGGDGSYVDFDPRARFSSKKGGVTEISGNEPDNKKKNTDQMDHLSGVNGGDLDVEEDYYEDEYSDSEDPRKDDNGCGYFMWKDAFDEYLRTISSQGSGYAPTECSSCHGKDLRISLLESQKHVLETRVRLLEARLEMARIPDDHACQSDALLRELLGDMENLRM